MIRTGISSLALILSLASAPAFANPAAAPAAAAAAPTVAEADAFVARAEKELADFSTPAQQAAWINATYITDDTDAIAAKFGAEGTEMGVRFALEAAKYAGVPGLSFDTKRKIDLLRNGLTLPAPTTPGAASELSTIVTKLGSDYGKGKGTLDGKPINGSDIEAAMGTVRDPAKSKEMWVSWHDAVGAPMRKDFAREVVIANQGAKGLGYADVGALWRSGYDMTPAQFEATTDTLWKQVEPLYKALHTYVRWKLNAQYGDAVQPKTGPIRADLLGNMWAQEWGNIYDVVAPAGAGDVGYDVGDLLKAKGYDPIKMFKTGEGFYSSLGFKPLPDTFWARSQIVKPADREVVCHASAWDIDSKDDVRIKMCTKVNGDDFVTIHHEMGHNYYQRAYKNQPFLYENGANDGFHEAIGDFVALSITPDYLVKIGLLDPAKVPSPDKDIGLLLKQAMDKVAFLPFGLLVDKWRWGVFSGATPEGQYEKSWNDLRLKYQGIVPPVARDETRFDPGAKYHVAASVPYARYFLARLYQFQFYQAACKQSGWTGPLHRCSFYGNKEVGAKLNAMLEMGQSKPWPEALAVFTGTREISGQAMVDYFAPLKAWLDKQNEGKPQGW
ncbi:peptidyl-dipeptidase A [Sphingomonas sp. BE270]|jgi:peptidyl-dipeptidase A|uniref:M2 family metallopeptidase n=1 Tax=unclassified Sphingomonas TaxID=196159 RepID=UPI00053D4F60|nr:MULTISPECIES: M2 family metallopeptidase [unclassified Sphingomonas]MDR6849202.1 peptidyl-dipeptidase A [Sphingomonas sp. BE137]MDR7259463.1 peptidyl-dipeptidase A [Sphingomonas sp. BE270]